MVIAKKDLEWESIKKYIDNLSEKEAIKYQNQILQNKYEKIWERLDQLRYYFLDILKRTDFRLEFDVFQDLYCPTNNILYRLDDIEKSMKEIDIFKPKEADQQTLGLEV